MAASAEEHLCLLATGPCGVQGGGDTSPQPPTPRVPQQPTPTQPPPPLTQPMPPLPQQQPTWPIVEVSMAVATKEHLYPLASGPCREQGGGGRPARQPTPPVPTPCWPWQPTCPQMPACLGTAAGVEEQLAGARAPVEDGTPLEQVLAPNTALALSFTADQDRLHDLELQAFQFDDPRYGARRPIEVRPGWEVLQIRPGLARAWVHPPVEHRPVPGPSLSNVPARGLLGVVLEVSHTRSFMSVCLKHPETSTPVWVNIWSCKGAKGNPRGTMFCEVRAPENWTLVEPEVAEVDSPCVSHEPLVAADAVEGDLLCVASTEQGRATPSVLPCVVQKATVAANAQEGDLPCVASTEQRRATSSVLPCAVHEPMVAAGAELSSEADVLDGLSHKAAERSALQDGGVVESSRLSGTRRPDRGNLTLEEIKRRSAALQRRMERTEAQLKRLRSEEQAGRLDSPLENGMAAASGSNRPSESWRHGETQPTVTSLREELRLMAQTESKRAEPKTHARP